MFGYLKFDKFAGEDLKKYYKYSYCSLCKALEQYYGQKSRLLLSYDITIFSFMLINPLLYKTKNKIRCLRGSVDSLITNALKPLCDLTIFLFREKMKDNIIDKQHVLLSRFLLFFYRRIIKKAQNNNPNLSFVVETELGKFYRNEKKLDIYELCNLFSFFLALFGRF